MPSLAAYHPIVVHFAIGLLVAGAVFRWVSLSGRAAFTGPAATSLLLAGTLAAVVAVKSGGDAHGPVERVPGTAAIVKDHEEWGERTRTVFIVVALVELVALALARKPEWARRAAMASGALCVAGVFCLYQAGEHGGELVYSYAGGVGVRTGDPKDVERLLIAAGYHQAAADRQAGKAQDAATIVWELARRHPDDAGIQLLAAESLLVDRRDPTAALAKLGSLSVPNDDARLRIRQGFLIADAHEAAGRPDAARATLQQLASAFPENQRIQQRLAGTAPPPAR